MKASSMRRIGAATIAAAAALALTPVSAHDRNGDGPSRPDPLVGYWVGTVTVVDCSSGASFFSFSTGQLINQGGTINTTDYTNPPTSSGPGFGYWYPRKHGGYFVRFRFAEYTPDGQVSGFRVVSKTVTLDGPDQQSSVISSAATDPSGNVLFTRCAKETATRFR